MAVESARFRSLQELHHGHHQGDLPSDTTILICRLSLAAEIPALRQQVAVY
jgi:hypothetical protein